MLNTDSIINKNTLTPAEARTVQHYFLDTNTRDDDSSAQQPEAAGGFAVDIVRAAAAKRARNSRGATKYRSLNHLVTTSNIVERLFSRAKLIMTALTSAN